MFVAFLLEIPQIREQPVPHHIGLDGRDDEQTRPAIGLHGPPASGES